MFYEGHKIVSDPLEGNFDKNAAEELIQKQEDFPRRLEFHIC